MGNMSGPLVIVVVAMGVFLFECYRQANKEWQTTNAIGNRIKIIALYGGLLGLSLIVYLGGFRALIGFFILIFGVVLLSLQQQLLDRLINDKNINVIMKKGIWFVLFMLALAVYFLGMYVISSVFPGDPSELVNLP